MKRMGIFVLAIALSFLPSGTKAEVTSIAITSSTSLGDFDGRPYIEATGTMHGNVERADGSSGVYHVPFSIQYPAHAEDCNGFALGEPLHQAAGPGSFTTIGSKYLFEHGYVHAAVGWDNSPGAGRSQGNTERLSDAHQVLKDLSALLRDPAPFLQGPCAADYVLAFGTSRTAAFWREFLHQGHNDPLLYDGLLLNTAGALRLDLSGPTRRFLILPGPLPEDGKVIAINGEHDVERYQGWEARPETPSYRVFEVAGSPHLAPFLLNLAPLGAVRQNPAYHGPVAKAMLGHLHDWILHGTEPPPSETLPGTVIMAPANDLVPPTGCTAPCPIYQFFRDEFGNAIGGVRLPFVEVPVGTYLGVETDLAAIAPANRSLVSQGGSFIPFSQETLDELYLNQGAFVKMISKSAGEARNRGWILGEDVGHYSSEGAHRDF